MDYDQQIYGLLSNLGEKYQKIQFSIWAAKHFFQELTYGQSYRG